MRKLLLVMGDLAAGKSTYANVLSQRYNVTLFSKDSIKEILGDTIGFSNREENLKLSHAAVELMTFFFSQLADLKKDLILESNFNTSELERLHILAGENGYDVLTLVIRGNVDILYKRYMNRMNNENRHPVHLSTTLDVYEDFKKCAEQAQKVVITGKILTICADDFSYQTDESILKQIDDFMLA